MGYGLSLHRFADGEAETLDGPATREVLEPHVVNGDWDAGELLVRAADGGEAEVNVSADGVSVDRFPPGGFLDIVAELANRLGAAVLLPDGVLVSGEERRADLPEGLRDSAVVIEMTGPGLERAIGDR
ncbi:hypothetical protein G3I51_33310 [Streptomyces sp. SID9944]|nr:hypothetical protein [Streptomyces sp. SID9944]